MFPRAIAGASKSPGWTPGRLPATLNPRRGGAVTRGHRSGSRSRRVHTAKEVKEGASP
jgi:hypothetical protein